VDSGRGECLFGAKVDDDDDAVELEGLPGSNEVASDSGGSGWPTNSRGGLNKTKPGISQLRREWSV